MRTLARLALGCTGVFVLMTTVGTVLAQGTPEFVQVSARTLSACGLRGTGSIDCWTAVDGTFLYTKPGPFTQVSESEFVTCGLTDTGDVECWTADAGTFLYPKPGPFTQVSEFKTDATCGLTEPGSIECWDMGSGTPRFGPPTGGPFTQVSSGGDQNVACGLTVTGSVECWNTFCGDCNGAPPHQPRPYTAPGGPFTQVSMNRVACGLTVTGSVKCWGDQDGTFLYTAPGGPFTQVSVGNNEGCGLTSTGSVECWNVLSGTAIYTAQGGPFTQVSVHFDGGCGLTGGNIDCWNEGNGQFEYTIDTIGFLLDDDGDGISNLVDEDPGVFSNNFSDIPLGGTTSGEITQDTTSPRDRTWQIIDEPGNGVRVMVSAGSMAAQITGTGTCTPQTVVDFPLDEPTELVMSCASTTVEVTQGSATVSTIVGAHDISVEVDAGGGVTIRPADDGGVLVENIGGTVLSGDLNGRSFSLPLDEAYSPLVAVDIKPRSCPNPLNVKSRGVLPVAILGSATVDVTEIDRTSVMLVGIRPARSNFVDTATPFGSQTRLDCSDCTNQSPDGVLDLVMQFDAELVVAALGEVDDQQCLILELTGTFNDGSPIAGEDIVRILKKK